MGFSIRGLAESGSDLKPDYVDPCLILASDHGSVLDVVVEMGPCRRVHKSSVAYHMTTTFQLHLRFSPPFLFHVKDREEARVSHK